MNNCADPILSNRFPLYTVSKDNASEGERASQVTERYTQIARALSASTSIKQLVTNCITKSDAAIADGQKNIKEYKGQLEEALKETDPEIKKQLEISANTKIKATEELCVRYLARNTMLLKYQESITGIGSEANNVGQILKELNDTPPYSKGDSCFSFCCKRFGNDGKKLKAKQIEKERADLKTRIKSLESGASTNTLKALSNRINAFADAVFKDQNELLVKKLANQYPKNASHREIVFWKYGKPNAEDVKNSNDWYCSHDDGLSCIAALGLLMDNIQRTLTSSLRGIKARQHITVDKAEKGAARAAKKAARAKAKKPSKK